MYTLRRLLRQHALTVALALVLALWLSGSWGVVHRVLHPGATASAPASAKSAAPGLAHEDGSTLCKLLDQLGHEAGPPGDFAIALPTPQSAALPMGQSTPLRQAQAVPFEARGPPRTA